MCIERTTEQKMNVDVMSKNSAIDKTEKALKSRLKNKELFDEIFNKFSGVISKDKMRFSISPNAIEVMDLTTDFGERILIAFEPSMDNYESLMVNYSNGQKYRKHYEFTFNNKKDVSIKMEETEFFINEMVLCGMVLKKTSKQYIGNQLMFLHEYASDSFVKETSVSTDILIHANPRGYANKRVVRVQDSVDDNSFKIDYFASNEFSREVFDTMNSTYIPAGYRPCNKDIYDKFFLTLKK